MPNWCTNKLVVSGPQQDVKAFRLKAKGCGAQYNSTSHSPTWEVHDDIRVWALFQDAPDDDGDEQVLCFHRLYPVPNDFRRFPYDDGQARKIGEACDEPRPYGGYTWQSKHWGTKWDACEPYLEDHPLDAQELVYGFDTAWGPPTELFEKVAKDFPSLTFELSYEEGGMGFAGYNTWELGECSAEDAWDIEWDEKEGEWNRA